MNKTSAIEPSEYSDESGRKISIATGPRIYFRSSLSTPENDFTSTSNSELNGIIAADVSGSETIKTFQAKSSSVSEQAQELGILKKSKQFGIYYVCIGSNSELRVIAIQTEIKTGKPESKLPSKIDTGVMDSVYSLPIRVSTTVRNIFRKDYGDTPFPPDTSKTFSAAPIKQLSEYIAKLYSSKAGGITHSFPLKDESVGEIRSFGPNRFFVSSIKDGAIDLLSVQGKWFSQQYSAYLKEKGYKAKKTNRGLGAKR